MTTTRFIVLRHGETAWNIEGLVQGHLDSPLTATGIAQGKALAERLASHSFTALYSSDLGRAQQTAALIAARTGHSIRFDARLRERHLGVFQGLTAAQIQERHPEEYRLYKTSDPTHRLPKGESARERFDSVVACVEELARRHAGEQIVVVTHGGVLAAVFRHAVGVPLEAPRRFRLPNASWNVFSHEAGRWFLDVWGDVSHLGPVESLDDF